MRSMRAWLSVMLLALSATTSVGRGQLANPGFEGQLEEAPKGWVVPSVVAKEGFIALLIDHEAHSGASAVRLVMPPGAPMFGNLLQSFDPGELRGKRLSLSAQIRVDGAEDGSRCQMWIRVDRPNRQIGFFDNMQDRPVRDTGGAWERQETIALIANDAARIVIGFMVFGATTVDVDSVAIEVLGEAGEEANQMQLPPARRGGYSALAGQIAAPLSDRGARNLVTLARAAGQLQYFDPGDAAAETVWDALLVELIPEFEALPDDAALVQALDRRLAPIAPGAQFWTGRREAGPTITALSAPDDAVVETVYWERLGFIAPADVGRNIYEAERVRVPAEAVLEATPPASALPAQTWLPPGFLVETELVDGLYMRFPAHRFATAEGTLPRGQAFAGPLGENGDDRTRRLAGVMIAWNALQHFFPYFGQLPQTDWLAALPATLRRAATARSIREHMFGVGDMLKGLHDGHAAVTHPGYALVFRLPIITIWSGNELVVTASEPGTGAQLGDVIVLIDGRPIAEVVAERRATVSGSPQWLDWIGGSRALMSTEGGVARLDVMRVDGSRVVLEVEREPMMGPPIVDPRPDVVTDLEPGIMYVDLGRVTDEDLRSAVPRLGAADGIVFDMRGYPRGIAPWFLSHLTDTPLHSASWQIPVVRLPDRHAWEWRIRRWLVPPAQPRFPSNVAFIIDGRTISYAESITGIVEKHGLGALVGTASAGANGNVTNIVLPGGEVVRWTGMRVVKQDGSPHHVIGVIPDVPVTRTRAGIAAGRDELLDAALEVVRQGR